MRETKRPDKSTLDKWSNILTVSLILAEQQRRNEQGMPCCPSSIPRRISNPILDQLQIQWFAMQVFERIVGVEKRLVNLNLIPDCDNLWRHLQDAVRRTLDERVGEQQFTDIVDEFTRYLLNQLSILDDSDHGFDSIYTIRELKTLVPFADLSQLAFCSKLWGNGRQMKI